MKQRNLLTRMLLLFALVVGSVTSVWGQSTPEGTFIIDFYDEDNLTSTSGTNLNSENYADFVQVPSGITATDVVTAVSVTGTVQFGKNGGLTLGTNSNTAPSAQKVTFTISEGYSVTKCTVYAAKYDGTRLLLNETVASSGSVADKQTKIEDISDPYIWDDLGGLTSLEFSRDNGNGGNCKRITIYRIICEYQSASPASPLFSISLSGTYKTTFNQGETFNHDGAIVTATYEDASVRVVTNSAEFSTPDMTTLGTKTVTVSYTEGEVTKEISYEITVQEYVQPTTVTINDWAALFGVASDAGAEVTKQDYTGTKDGVTIVYKQATNMYIKTNDLRIYNGSKLSFTAPIGYYFTKVAFQGTSSSEKAPTADTGEFNYSTREWTGFASSFTLSRNSGKDYTKFTSATITLVKVINTTVAASGYSTLSNSNGLDFANAVADDDEADDLVAYIIPSNDGAKLTMSTVNEAPASTGILLKGTPGVTYTIPVKAYAASVGTNLLKAGPVTIPEGNETIYLLSGGQFHIAAAGTTSPGKAYLELPAAVGAPALSMDFGGETTGINPTLTLPEGEGTWYDLSGRRVAQPTKGVFIKNGKKVLVP